MDTDRIGNTEGRHPRDVLHGRSAFIDTCGHDDPADGGHARQPQAAADAHPRYRGAECARITHGTTQDSRHGTVAMHETTHVTPHVTAADIPGALPAPTDYTVPEPARAGTGQEV